jgi:hypothetical protein
MIDKQELARLRKRVEQLEMTLRVIHTWATCFDDRFETRLNALHDIKNKCKEALGYDRDT